MRTTSAPLVAGWLLDRVHGDAGADGLYDDRPLTAAARRPPLHGRSTFVTRAARMMRTMTSAAATSDRPAPAEGSGAPGLTGKDRRLVGVMRWMGRVHRAVLRLTAGSRRQPAGSAGATSSC